MTGCTSQPKTPLLSKTDKSVQAIPTPLWLGDITAIALEWEPNHDPSIAGYTIYKKEKNTDAPFKLVTQIEDRFTSHYIDLNLPSNTKYLYRVLAYNKAGIESIPAKPASTITRPTLNSISYITALDRLPRKVKLIWRPHGNGRVNGYILERKEPDDSSWSQIKTFDHRLVAEYIDTMLEDNSIYQYRIIALTFDGLESTPSDIVTVNTKKLPAPIEKVKITQDLPKEIILTWEKHPQKDISHYNVYRSDSKRSGYTFQAKVKDLKYSDKIEKHGQTLYYRLSAVDYDGLEAPRTKNFSGRSLPRPKKPTIKSTSSDKDQVTIAWEAGDTRTTHYKVIQHVKEGWFSTKKSVIDPKEKTSLTVTIPPNMGVYFEVIGIDKYEIESKAIQTDTFLFEKVVQ
ncbi:MAG: hypothetical protein OEW60_05310 [Thiovulaceae bacterium]|nr:hypothetical protein [Sulfurimonadaceae bacterium]